MRKIILITDYFRPGPGGIEALHSGIAKHWPADNIEVIVSGPSVAGGVTDFDALQSYPVYRRSPLESGSKTVYREYLEFLKHRVRAFKPDHIILGNVSRSTSAASFVAREYQVPYSVFLNDIDLEAISLLRFKNRRMLREARYIFTVSGHIANVAMQKGIPGEMLVTIPPAVEEHEMRSGAKYIPEEIREAIYKKLTFLSVGPLVKDKGMDQFFPVMEELRTRNLRFHWVIAGSGPEYSYLKEMIRIHNAASDVTLAGFVTDEVLRSLYRKADFFLHPARSDTRTGFSYTILEAMDSGLPVLAGRTGCSEEVIENGSNGYLIDFSDPAGISDRLEELALSLKERERLSRNAKDYAGRFSMEQTTRAVLQRI